MKNYIKLLRVKHWIKNFLIFIPVIFARMLDINNAITLAVGFISFSLVASSIYILNDIQDKDKDKNHPRKKNRPIASGRITVSSAYIITMFLVIISFVLNSYINKSIINSSFYVLLAYFIINILYSYGLKNIPILDVVLLAGGFVLRVYYGAFLINVSVSNWLFLTILNASLFMGLGKRLKELSASKNSSKGDVRKVLEKYSENFLESFMYICLALSICFYSLWTMEQNIPALVYSIPLLMIILMEYCLNLSRSDEGDPTTILYQNKSLIVTAIIYCIYMGIIMVR